MEEKQYGGYILRLLAYLFDMCILWLVPLTFLLAIVTYTNTTTDFWVSLLWLFLELLLFQWLLSYLYFILTFLWFNGSLGKLVAGLSIEKENGEKPTIGDALIRFPVGYLVSSLALGLGFFWIIKDPKKKSFHDHFVGTVVVKKNSPIPLVIALPCLIGVIFFLCSAIYQTGVKRNLWQKVGTEVESFSKTVNQIIRENTQKINERNIPPAVSPYPIPAKPTSPPVDFNTNNQQPEKFF